MLTREAWNALLKILEEPPPGVVFVFATTEPAKIFNTAAPVLSRLQRFDFRRIGPAAIRTRLAQVLAAEKLAADDDALHAHRAARRRRHARRPLRARPVPLLRRRGRHRRAGARGPRPRRRRAVRRGAARRHRARSRRRLSPRGAAPRRRRRPGRVPERHRRNAALADDAAGRRGPGGDHRVAPRLARGIPRPADRGRRPADAPAPRRERNVRPPQRQRPPRGGDAAAPLDHDGPHGGPRIGARGRHRLPAPPPRRPPAPPRRRPAPLPRGPASRPRP